MNIIDLTHVINENMSVYFEDERPTIKDICSCKEHGFAQKSLNIFTHTGTHIDAPAHVFEDGKTLDDYPIDHFVGNAFILNCENKEKCSELIKSHKDIIDKVDFLLFNFGWDKKWGKESYTKDFPTIDDECVSIIKKFKLKAIGVDTISPDKLNDNSLSIHKSLLSDDILIIENLSNLDKCPKCIFKLYCMTLNIENADGAPARVFAVI